MFVPNKGTSAFTHVPATNASGCFYRVETETVGAPCSLDMNIFALAFTKTLYRTVAQEPPPQSLTIMHSRHKKTHPCDIILCPEQYSLHFNHRVWYRWGGILCRLVTAVLGLRVVLMFFWAHVDLIQYTITRCAVLFEEVFILCEVCLSLCPIWYCMRRRQQLIPPPLSLYVSPPTPPAPASPPLDSAAVPIFLPTAPHQLLVDKTDQLNQQAFRFDRASRSLRRTMYWRKVKTGVAAVAVGVVLMFAAGATACGGVTFSHCRS